MQLGLVTIQKNRGPWLLEWFAFHYLVGFRKFYFYAHMCDDQTAQVLTRLKKRLDISAIALPDPGERIQLQAYQHACQHYMDEVDWMCFLDGDEFIFPTAANTMQEALWHYDALPVSALGVYNANFGSAGHQAEPDGLITENYRMRAELDSFMPHRRVKSLVKGRQRVDVSGCSNVFVTPGGTYDELLRPISWGYQPQYEPSYQHFRFNHYVCQSRAYYENFKRTSGHADGRADELRPDEWWENFDTNAVRDDGMDRWRARLVQMVDELRTAIAA